MSWSLVIDSEDQKDAKACFRKIGFPQVIMGNKKAVVMWIWAIISVSGICTVLSFYMAFLAFRISDNGALLFLGFGLFWGTLCVISSMKVAARNSAFSKCIDDKRSEESKPVVFVPHGFLMLAIIITVMGILAAIFIPIWFG